MVEIQDKQEQRRLLWQMRMARLITDIEVYARSVGHWRTESERLAKTRSRKITNLDRAKAHDTLVKMEQGLSDAENALVEFAKAHPYPGEEADKCSK